MKGPFSIPDSFKLFILLSELQIITFRNERSFDRTVFGKTTLSPNKYQYLIESSTGIHVQVVIVVIIVVVVIVIVVVVRVNVVVDS